MILDAQGREIRRAVGFLGGLRVDSVPKRLVDQISSSSVYLEETYEPIEECSGKGVSEK